MTKTAEEIAKDTLASMQAAKDAVKSEEDKAKGAKDSEAKKVESQNATTGSSPEKEKEVAIEQNVSEDTEREAKEQQLLQTDDAELSEEQRAEKAKLLEAKEAKNVEENKKDKDNTQKRIDKLTGDLKDLKREGMADKEEIRRLQAELEESKERMRKLENPESAIVDSLDKSQEARINKYLMEDKDLPRERRREMSREELEEWLTEDLVSANEWLAKRTVRRDREWQEEESTMKAKSEASIIVEKQKESERRVFAKYPELNHSRMLKELMDSGKTESEAKAEMAKDEKTIIINDILSSLTDEEKNIKYFFKPNGPELLIADMEKILAKNKEAKKQTPNEETAEEKERRIREEAAEAERQRQESIDSVGSSTRAPIPEKTQTEFYKKQLEIAQRAGISKETLDKRLEVRKNILGL